MATDQEIVARVEGILEQLSARVSDVEARLTSLENRVQTQFFWLVGVQITLWVTIMLAILLKD